MNEESIFIEALQKQTPQERAAFLDRACAGNPELRKSVELLLKSHDKAGHFLQNGPDPYATRGESIRESPGTMIGPYKLLQQLGEGGMGTVFMAEQARPVQRTVAVKLIKAGMDSKSVLARFEAERQALALMDHPNIAKVFDAGTSDRGLPYFVMELVKGAPITKYCDDRHLTPRQRLQQFVPVCQAIEHAHQKGVIHRDLKPSNVLVCLYDGRPVPKVIDFGVAKATGRKLTDKTLFTEVGAVVGTLQYMSPEQAEINQLDVDTRSDVYSLGVLLYELLTGTTPLERDRLKQVSFLEVLRLIREEESPRPSTRLSTTLGLPAIAANRGLEPRRLNGALRGDLDWIVMRALEKDRSRRYETASALAADVQRYLNDESVHACPPSAWYRFRKYARRNKVGLVAATAVVLAMVIALAGLAISNFLITSALDDATVAKEDLKRTNEHQRVEAYFRRITLAHGELSANNLGTALKILGECPENLRGWEWDYLMRLCRVEPVIIRDKVGVQSIAFGPDGKRLASVGGDGAIKVWNSRTGNLITTIPAHAGIASSIAFHPAGQHLVSVGTDKLAKVWDLTTDPPRMVFDRPCDAIHVFGTAYAAAFSPLNPDYFAVGYEGTVRIWNWKNRQLVRALDGRGNHRISLAFNSDGRRLASGNWQGSVSLWDPEAEGAPLCTFPETRHSIAALAFSPDGGRLATASFDRRVDVWDAPTGRFLYKLPHSGALALGVAFSRDGKILASAGEDKTVYVWDATSERMLLALHGHTGLCGCVTFSPDGLRLASASMDGTIRLWDATPLRDDERQEMAPDFKEHDVEVWSLAVSPDRRQIVSGGFGPPAMVWDAKTKAVSARFGDHDRVNFCVAWHPDGRRVALAGANGDQFTVKVKALDATGEQDDFELPVTGSEYFAVAFSPDGRYLVTGNAKGLVQVWDANNGEPVRQPIRTLGTHKGVVRGVVFSPHPDRMHIGSVGSNGEVKLWDASRLGEKETPQQPLRTILGHSPGAFLNVAFSPDGKQLATGGMENTVKVWNVETGDLLHTLRGHTGDVCTVAFSPDGCRVASAGEDSTVKVWDSRTGGLLCNFRGHTGLVSTMTFLDDRTLITGSRDHTVKFWHVAELEKVTDR